MDSTSSSTRTDRRATYKQDPDQSTEGVTLNFQFDSRGGNAAGPDIVSAYGTSHLRWAAVLEGLLDGADEQMTDP